MKEEYEEYLKYEMKIDDPNNQLYGLDKELLKNQDSIDFLNGVDKAIGTMQLMLWSCVEKPESTNCCLHDSDNEKLDELQDIIRLQRNKLILQKK